MNRKIKNYGFEFGQFVDVRGKYVRVKGGPINGTINGYEVTIYSKDYRYWKVEPVDLKNCLYIGIRTLKNGIANHEDADKGYKIDVDKYIRCAVVVENEYRKPINVPFDCIG